MNIQDSRLLRDKEAADLLGIAPQTLRKSRMDGMLLSVPAPKPICIGRSVRYKSCITLPAVSHKILAHLDKKTLLEAKNDSLMPPLRASPATASFSDYIIQRDFDFGA